MRVIQKVAVLGAGTMGSRIAAHFANAGIPALLLDIVIPNQPDRNAAAKKGLESAIKQRPVGFFTEDAIRLVETGNFDDDLGKVAGCDWIIEAVTENLEIKRVLWRKVETLRKPDAIVSTNTSGIPLRQISEGFSKEFRAHFLGTHFFNPPRYLHLLEVIPDADTDAAVLEFVKDFGDRRLGKGIVVCKDTPNFIANRIGSFFGATVGKITSEGGYTVEEVDAITGSLIGLPNSASFRLLDIVGIDVWDYVNSNLYKAVPDDPWRERFVTPEIQRQLVGKGWLGEKSGQGFYKRVGPAKEIHALDLKTLEYRPAQKVKFESAEAAKGIGDLGKRMRKLVEGTDRVGDFLWKLYSDLFQYSAERIPEISDTIYEIDRAMRWGYAHSYGPFEMWDAIGFEYVRERMKAEGRKLPAAIEKMAASGAQSLYRHADRAGQPGREYFDFASNSYRLMDPAPQFTVLADVKRARGVVQTNAGGSLVDLGDGVLCVEFHSKMNSIGGDTIAILHAGLAETEKNYEALVVANQGANFSVGANLLMVLLAAQNGEWDELNQSIHQLQQAMMDMKYARKPVVTAPFAQTLGGGAEIAMHGVRAQASAELYMGLVEVGVGVIPAGGGCKELIARLKDPRRVFELVGQAKVSGSAEEARKFGLLTRFDRITMNQERLIADAKELALSLVKDYTPGVPRTDIDVQGEPGLAALQVGLYMMRQGGYITEHDAVVGGKLAHVLCGGKLSGPAKVSEQYLLDLEREAFLSLCGNAKTQERMAGMLQTGKPVRN